MMPAYMIDHLLYQKVSIALLMVTLKAAMKGFSTSLHSSQPLDHVSWHFLILKHDLLWLSAVPTICNKDCPLRQLKIQSSLVTLM